MDWSVQLVVVFFFFFSCASMAVAWAVNGHGVDRWSWVGSLFVRPFSLISLSLWGDQEHREFRESASFLLAWRRSILAAAMRAQPSILAFTSSLIQVLSHLCIQKSYQNKCIQHPPHRAQTHHRHPAPSGRVQSGGAYLIYSTAEFLLFS